jgi:ferredoxin
MASSEEIDVSGPRGLSAPSVTVKVCVNRQRCQGHARRVALAPELFELDEFGEGHAIGDGLVRPDLHDKAHLAKANCPESAIGIEEG